MGNKFKSRRNTRFKESVHENNDKYMQYLDRLTEYALTSFEWLNLPDTVDERFMEMTLFNKGNAIFFKDDTIGFLCLPCTIGGTYNVYNIPIKRRAYANNGYQEELTPENSVIIYNNYLRKPSVRDIQVFSKTLYEIDEVIKVNLNAQKTPCLISCSEEQKLAMKNMYMMYDGNMPVIFGDKQLNPNSIQAINTGAPYLLDKLTMLKEHIWNEALTFLGISNVQFQKKERMVSDEVLRTQGGTIASRYSRLNMRKKACEEINKMFGLNIDVRFREDYEEMDDSEEPDTDSENDSTDNSEE